MKFRLLALLLCVVIYSQSGYSQSFQNQRTKLTLLNIGFNGIASGVGSLINKQGWQTSGQAFWRGFKRGAVGGAVIDLGIRSTRLIATQQQLWLAWPARIISSTGNAIVYNASLNQGWLDELSFNFLAFRLDYHMKTKQFRTRLFPSSLYGIIRTGGNGRFDLGRTLETGVIYIEGDTFGTLGGEGIATGQVSTIGMGRSIPDDNFYDIYAHELVHIMQYERFNWFNAYLNKTDMKLKEQYKWYKELSRYIYFDLNGPAIFIAYSAERNRPHNCRLFEQEATNYGEARYYGCR